MQKMNCAQAKKKYCSIFFTCSFKLHAEHTGQPHLTRHCKEDWEHTAATPSTAATLCPLTNPRDSQSSAKPVSSIFTATHKRFPDFPQRDSCWSPHATDHHGQFSLNMVFPHEVTPVLHICKTDSCHTRIMRFIRKTSWQESHHLHHTDWAQLLSALSVFPSRAL